MSTSQPQKAAWEEGVALGVLRELEDPAPPMNAISLARACGLRVVEIDGKGARLVGRTIEVPARAQLVRKHGLVAHELAHWALLRAGEPSTEAAADYVAGALMLPRAVFDRDLRSTGWDIRQLRAKHVNCSAELIARRIANLRDACVTVWDNGKLKTRLHSPWLAQGYRRMSTFERELAAQVLESGETIEAGALLWGFAVFQGAWRRVITVCEAEQLAMRF